MNKQEQNRPKGFRNVRQIVDQTDNVEGRKFDD